MHWTMTSFNDGTEAWLPDIAKMVRERLTKTSKLKSSKHSATAMGESILRQLSEQRTSTGSLRLSSSGGCERALAYTYHHYVENGYPIDASSKIAFTIGDVTEAFIVSAIAEAFENESRAHRPALMFIGAEQEEVSLQVPIEDGRVANVPGHPDGSMAIPIKKTHSESNEPPEWGSAILEVKSMSDYAFKKFRKSGLDPSDSYYKQVQSYMASKGYGYTYLIAYGKATTAKEAVIDDDGNWWPAFPIVGQWIKYDEAAVQAIKDKFRRVILSKSPEDIERPYGPDKKGRLSFPCDYCRYWKTCFPGGEERAEESRWLQKTNKIKIYIMENDDA